MVVEVSFSKNLFSTGSPTISLAILLSSLLVDGDGVLRENDLPEKIGKRLYVVSSAIVVLVSFLFVCSPLLFR